MTSQPDGRKPSILLIDDNEELLKQLRSELEDQLAPDGVDVRTWTPVEEDRSPEQLFWSFVDDDTFLVVTDYDLTGRGKTGLFGPSIVGWCQSKAIPVGDFSRGMARALPAEPNLFELRVPTGPG